MLIEIGSVSEALLNRLKSDKIVLVKTIEVFDREALIEVNGEILKAKISSKIPPTFFAYVEKSIDEKKQIINLKIIENFKFRGKLESYISKNSHETVRNFLIENGLPLLENYINIGMLILKNGIPLHFRNFDLIYHSFMRYGLRFTLFLISLIKKEKKIDEDSISLLANLKYIIKKYLSNKKLFSSFEDWKSGKIDMDVDKNFLILLSFVRKITEDKSYQAFLLKYLDDSVIVQQRNEEKNKSRFFYFDFSSERLKHFFVSVEINEYEVKIDVFLDKGLIDENKVEIESKKQQLQQRMSSLFPNKRSQINFHQFDNNIIFENSFSSENNKEGLINLDIMV